MDPLFILLILRLAVAADVDETCHSGLVQEWQNIFLGGCIYSLGGKYELMNARK